MARYKFEAMDATGAEIKDEISIPENRVELVHQAVRQMGYFVTHITRIDNEEKNELKERFLEIVFDKYCDPIYWIVLFIGMATGTLMGFFAGLMVMTHR